MKTEFRRCLTRSSMILLALALFTVAEVRSGFWLLMEPSADSLCRIDFSGLTTSPSSPLYRNISCDTGAADCFLRNGHIVAPRGVFDDPALSSRCDSIIAGKNVELKYRDQFYLDSMMKRIQLSLPPETTFADSVIMPRSCRVFFVRTRESHIAVIFRVGEYIGGINRTWYYWAYQSDGGAALFKQQLCELPDPRQLTIELDVFSGRPNPVFVIDDSATVAAITNAAFGAVNTLFDTTLQTVGMSDCPSIPGYRGLSVSGGFNNVDNKYSDYLPTFVICAGRITLNHALVSAIAPLMAADRDARLEKLVIGYGCERNLTVTDAYGTLRFCDLIPDSLKPISASIDPARRATRDMQPAMPAVSIYRYTAKFTGARNVRSIDLFNLMGVHIGTIVCRGGKTASFSMPYVGGGCLLARLRFTDGSRAEMRSVVVR